MVEFLRTIFPPNLHLGTYIYIYIYIYIYGELSNAAKRCSMRKQSIIVAYLDFRPCYRRFHALGDRQASDGWVD